MKALILFITGSDHDKCFSLREKKIAISLGRNQGLTPGAGGSVPRVVMLAFPRKS